MLLNKNNILAVVALLSLSGCSKTEHDNLISDRQIQLELLDRATKTIDALEEINNELRKFNGNGNGSNT